MTEPLQKNNLALTAEQRAALDREVRDELARAWAAKAIYGRSARIVRIAEEIIGTAARDAGRFK